MSEEINLKIIFIQSIKYVIMYDSIFCIFAFMKLEIIIITPVVIIIKTAGTIIILEMNE